MVTEVERASQRLFGPGGLGVKNISIFPGANANTTPEQFAAALNKAFDDIEAGRFEEVTDTDSDLVALAPAQ